MSIHHIDYPHSTPTQQYVCAQSPPQLVPPLAGFHFTKSFTLILYFAEIVAQVSSFTTKWKVLQFVVMPVWYGVGVAMPLPGVVEVGLGVGVGVWPTMDMQMYY